MYQYFSFYFYFDGFKGEFSLMICQLSRKKVDGIQPSDLFFCFFFYVVFRSSDGASPAGGPEPLAAPRSLLPAAAALGHHQEVHGGLRDAGAGAARPDARAGESRPPSSTPPPLVC